MGERVVADGMARRHHVAKDGPGLLREELTDHEERRNHAATIELGHHCRRDVDMGPVVERQRQATPHDHAIYTGSSTKSYSQVPPDMSTTRESRTPKTASESRWSESASNRWVITGL